MPAIVTLPFNNDQGTTTIKTSSYTVGAGKYSFAQPLHYDCELNAVSVTLHGTFNPASNEALSNGIMFLGAVNSDKVVSYSFSRNSGAQTAQLALIVNRGATNEMFALTTLTSSGSAIFNCGQLIASSSPTLDLLTNGVTPAQNQHFGVYLIVNNAGSNWTVTTSIYTTHSNGFWVKAGDVLTGSRWLVTEYNSIS